MEKHKRNAIVACGIILRRREYPKRFGRNSYLSVKTVIGSAFQNIAGRYALYRRGIIPRERLLDFARSNLDYARIMLWKEERIKLGETANLADLVITEMDRLENFLRKVRDNQ